MRTQPLIFLSILLIISILLDIYVYKGLKQVFSSTTTKLFRSPVLISFWSYNIILYIGMIYVIGNLSPVRNDTLLRLASMVFGMLILGFIPKLIFSIFHLLDDLSFLGKRGVYAIIKSKSENSISRFDFLTKLGFGLATVPFIGILYGMFKGKYDFEVVRQSISIPNLPKNFEGLNIIHISDLHLGSFNKNFAAVQPGIDKINALNADYVFFTGDMVNNYADEAEGWEKILSSIKAKYGKFSVLGNHDYGDYVGWKTDLEKKENLESLKAFHQKVGFKLLLNEHVKLNIDDEYIQLIGVENWGTGGFAQYGKLKHAMRDVKSDVCQILLSHDPSHWEAEIIPNTGVDLTLSGHTHGMQFGIRLGNFKYSPIQHRYKQWSGLYQNGEKKLYVNRGFGFLGFPGRVGMAPEITHIILHAEQMLKT